MAATGFNSDGNDVLWTQWTEAENVVPLVPSDLSTGTKRGPQKPLLVPVGKSLEFFQRWPNPALNSIGGIALDEAVKITRPGSYPKGTHMTPARTY